MNGNTITVFTLRSPKVFWLKIDIKRRKGIMFFKGKK